MAKVHLAEAQEVLDKAQATRGMTMRVERLRHYLDVELKPYVRTWSEATLSATLWVLHELLGIDKFWYHSYLGGIEFKGPQCNPPRSLYTKLPRRFCFQRTHRCPSFLRPAHSIPLRRHFVRADEAEPHWWYMNLRALD